MIIPIVVPRPGVPSSRLPPACVQLGHDQVLLVELQGTLDVEGADGELIGRLNVADINKPTLVIGHHVLEGKVVTLAKPWGVLHKHAEAGTRWDVMAVVRKKMVFSKRPMPAART